ncbi:hypothetical protein [Uliginosibacterium sp. TH139]|uniref:hypothetical protein n=1 Tax=Uliginosibacterium sp. TH139 TaxID=2067453 RepID=UPI0011811888|nr:hypothetical protein [Uliginosibacterium sp. TH139]
MIALFTISPTIAAFAIMWGSVLLGSPVEFERFSWLLTDAQLVFLVIGMVATIFARKSGRTMSAWRIAANKYIGWVMAAAGLFYVVAFALVAHHGP